MKKAKDILNLPIILLDTGESRYSVKDVLFSREKRRILGFLIDEGGWFKGAKILLYKDINNIGQDAIMVEKKEYILSSTKVPEVEKILEEKYKLLHMEVFDIEGNRVGHIEDITFNEENGKIEILEISESVFEDLLNGRINLPLSEDVKFEAEKIIIYKECISKIHKSGGLKKYFIEENQERKE